jgi:hypothetical protein
MFAGKLAEKQRLPANEVFENIPPKAEMYPGTLLNPDGTVLDIGSIDDDRLKATHLSAEAEVDPSSFGSSAAVYVWPFLNRYRDRLTIGAAVSDAGYYIVPSDSYAVLVADSKAAKAVLQRGAGLQLVDRAWSGRLTLRISRKSGVDDTSWAELVAAVGDDIDQAAQRAAVDAEDADRVIDPPTEDATSFNLAIGKPVVCAYSLVELRRVDRAVAPRRLLVGGSADQLMPRALPTPPRAPRPWTLATVSSGWYSAMATMNQPWNGESAAVLAGALASYQPAASLHLAATREQPLTSEATLQFARQVAEDAKRRHARLVVFYYVGHMVTYEDNSLALLMGDAGRTRVAARRVGDLAPMGGNLAELARSLGTIARKAAPPLGELDVADLYDAIASTGTAFVLLIDGCMQADKFASFRERLGLVIGPKQESELFVGPGTATDALRSFADGLRHFPDGQSYLSSKNPVVLGAAPGTIASVQENPTWRWGAPVGPLARYVATTVQRSELWADRPSLPRLLNWSAENQQVGEINLKGTISWSDWLPLLSARTALPS